MEEHEDDEYHFDEDDAKDQDARREVSAKLPEPLGLGPAGTPLRGKSQPKLQQRRTSGMANGTAPGSPNSPNKHASLPSSSGNNASAAGGAPSSSASNKTKSFGRIERTASSESLGSGSAKITNTAKGLKGKIMSAVDRRRSSIMQRMGYSHATAGGRLVPGELDAMLGATQSQDPSRARPFSAPVPRQTGPSQMTVRQNLTPEEKAWEEKWTTDELPYYYNSLTEGVTWEKPDALKTEEELEHEAGEWTWVPHPTNVWQGARVLRKMNNGDVECKTLQGGKKMVIPASRTMKDANTNGREQRVPLWPLVKSSLYLLEDDLVALDDPNEGLILHNLRARFAENKIYTWVGASRSVLVSVNPYKHIKDLYNSETVKVQREKSPNRPPPPHVFGITSDALDSLLYDAQNNAILISGESGAGKTEATKHCLKFLAQVAGTKSHVEKRVLDANPILEAFGNAKTLRNNNSSRFGKWVEVNFDSKTRQISGATITTYLLERSRVAYQNKGERSFHIFYQLCTNEQFKMLYGLNAPAESFRYLAHSGCTTIDGVDDEKNLAAVIKAMTEMGFETNEQEWIMRTACAILHLGQIDFEAVDDVPVPKEAVESLPAGTAAAAAAAAGGNAQGVQGSKISNKRRMAMGRATPRNGVKGNRRSSLGKPARSSIVNEGESGVYHLKEAARLLGAKDSDLEKSLCFRSVLIRGERSHIPLNCEEARIAADSFAMTIYARMFEFIVSRVNECLGGGGKGHFIGILDIFGFEIFEKNSFEQLCINFANEKLQQQFNQSMFKEEEELYVFEDIEFEKVEFKDNALVLSLIDGRPDGLLPQLDDEVKTPGGSDERFASKMTKMHEKNVRFRVDAKRKMENPLAFQIMHYAGMVKYDGTGFVRANTDTLYEDLHMLGNKSEDKMLRELFPVDADGKPARYAPVFIPVMGGNNSEGRKTMISGARGRGQSQNPTLAVMGAQVERANRTNAKRPNTTVSAEFRDQLTELLTLLEQTESKYIRCIKPNNLQQGDLFDSSLVLEQLNYSGVFEAVEIRRKGFPFRWTHRQFAYQYKIINTLLKEKIRYHSREDDYRGLSEEILDNAPGKRPFRDVKIGRTRVLYKAKEHKLLLLLRNLALEKMLPWLQSRLRGYIARRMRRIFAECDSILQDAIDLENDLDALEGAFAECDELIGPHIPQLFPRARPLKRKQADKLVDDLKQWLELEAVMEELENDPRDVNELFFELQACLARCEGLRHIALTRRQERLLDGLKEKVETCALAKTEERWGKLEERMTRALESLDRARMRTAVTEFESDKELCTRACPSVDRMRALLGEMDDVDRRAKLAVQHLDVAAMKQCLAEVAAKFPKYATDDLGECKRLIALRDKDELEFCTQELAVAIKFGDERRRIHREIRIQELKLAQREYGERYTPLRNNPNLRSAEAWAGKASFLTKLFSKDKIVRSFLVYSNKPIHYPLTTCVDGDNPEVKRLTAAYSKCIVAYMGEAEALNPDELAKQLLQIGVQHPKFRDEIFVHMAKMLTQNSEGRSVTRGEELLWFCLYTFPPSAEFEPWLIMWIRDRFPRENDRQRKFVSAMHQAKYGPGIKSVPGISTMRTEYQGWTRSRYSLQDGESSGPSNPDALAAT